MKRVSGTRRWLLWAPLLAVSGWLAFFGEPPAGSAVVSLPSRATPPANPVAAPPRAEPQPRAEVLAALVPRDRLLSSTQALARTAAPRDPFSARSWNPPPAAAAAVPEAVPTAPPVPYAFIGKKHEGETWEVYLSRGEHTFVAREGETLEGSYRVERIAPPTLTLTYLPLSQAQTLSIGDAR